MPHDTPTVRMPGLCNAPRVHQEDRRRAGGPGCAHAAPDPMPAQGHGLPSAPPTSVSLDRPTGEVGSFRRGPHWKPSVVNGVRLALAVVFVASVSSCSSQPTASGEAYLEHSFGTSGLPGDPGRLDQGNVDPFDRNPYRSPSTPGRGGWTPSGSAHGQVPQAAAAAGPSSRSSRFEERTDSSCVADDCTHGDAHRHDGSYGPTTEAAVDPLDPRHYVIRPWTFDGREGEHVATPNFDVYTTIERRWLRTNAPRFQEAALAHYQHSIADLPSPGRRLETYLFGDREQWEAFAADMMGSHANAFLQMGRGGFSTRGRAVMYDIGLVDTLAIASHEGWHQYTQATFKDRLPVWMEEGIATWMEGHRLHRDEAPSFLPWQNLERYDQLRSAWEAERLWSLRELLETHPQEMLEKGDPARGLDYYAQVWALTHFLLDGEGSRYSDALGDLLLDAANGRMSDEVRARFGRSQRSANRRPVGSEVFRTYFGEDLDRLDQEYQAFIELLLLPGTRTLIAHGRQPERLNAPSGPGAGEDRSRVEFARDTHGNP